MRNLRMRGKQLKVFEKDGKFYARTNGTLMELPTYLKQSASPPPAIQYTLGQRIMITIKNFIMEWI